MAVSANPRDTKLSIKYEYDDNGEIKLKTKTYSNIKPSATDEQLYNAASGLSSLQANNVSVVLRRDESELVQV